MERWEYDEVAEKDCLGLILEDSSQYDFFAETTTEKSFRIDRHKWVWAAFEKCHETNVPIDVNNVAYVIKEAGKLQELGSTTEGDGELYLKQLRDYDKKMYPKNARDRLRDSAISRSLKAQADYLLKLAVSKGLDGIEKIDRAALEFAKITARADVIKPVELLTADDILSTEWPEPNWAIDGLLPVGLTIFAGRPKIGKSVMELQKAFAIGVGGQIFGIPVEQRPVLYVCLEDNPRRIKARMQEQGWPKGLPVEFMFADRFRNQIGNLNEGGGERLARQIEDMQYGLVMIDTFSRAIKGEQKDVGDMTRALAPIQEMAMHQNMAAIITDHHNKVTGRNPDAILDILGSTAKGAVADTIWGLYAESGKLGAKLRVVGRDVDDRTLQITKVPNMKIWDYEGEADEVEINESQTTILGCLEEMGELTLTQVSEAVGKDKSNTRRRLFDLINFHRVSRRKVGSAFLYKLKEEGLPDYLID